MLIADDHPLILLGLRRVFDRTERIEVVGEARSGPELLRMVERRRPDVVLLDLPMPGMTGPASIEQIKTARPHIKLVVLSAHEDEGTINAALNAGATAYIVKRIKCGGYRLDRPPGCERRGVSPAVALSERRGPGSAVREPLLTAREHLVLAAVVAGLTPRRSAGTCGLASTPSSST